MTSYLVWILKKIYFVKTWFEKNNFCGYRNVRTNLLPYPASPHVRDLLPAQGTPGGKPETQKSTRVPLLDTEKPQADVDSSKEESLLR